MSIKNVNSLTIYILFPSDVVPLYGVLGGLSGCVLLLVAICIIFAGI